MNKLNKFFLVLSFMAFGAPLFAADKEEVNADEVEQIIEDLGLKSDSKGFKKDLADQDSDDEDSNNKNSKSKDDEEENDDDSDEE